MMAVKGVMERYAEGTYVFYPQMKDLIHRVMADSGEEVVFSEHFAQEEPVQGEPWKRALHTIHCLGLQVLHRVRMYFFPVYRAAFQAAAKKIEGVYVQFEGFRQRLKQATSALKAIPSARMRVILLADALSLLQYQKERWTQFQEELPLPQERVGETLFDRLDTILSLRKTEVIDMEHWLKSPLNREDVAPRLQDLEHKQRTAAHDLRLAGLDYKMLKRKEELFRRKLEGVVEEIRAAGLERCFDLKEIPSSFPVSSKSPLEEMRDVVREPRVKELWMTLLKLLPPGCIQKWHCNAQGRFALRLDQPYQIWVPGLDPKGGAVLLLGSRVSFNLFFPSKDKISPTCELQGEVTAEGIRFLEGMYSYADSRFGTLYAKLNAIRSTAGETVVLEGERGLSGEKEVPFATLLSNWQRGKLVEGNAPSIFEAEIKAVL